VLGRRVRPGGRRENWLSYFGPPVRWGDECDARLLELPKAYEPYVAALSNRFLMPLPQFVAARAAKDNWQKTAWD
jgi:hypothetical protein